MPNWVYNTLTIQGPKEQIDSIQERLNKPFTRIHDSWNMETKEMEKKEYTYSNPIFSFWNIIAPTDLEAYEKQTDYSKPLEETLKFESDDWYAWNVRNWGTKWDVSVADGDEYPDTELIEHKSEGEDQWLVYSFNTAWSPPIPAIEKISLLVPNCVITLSYEEEQGWGGEIEFVNGEMTAQSSYDNKCRDCDEINTLDYCENGCGEICDSCHYMAEADLECVAECDTHKVFLDDEHVPEYRRVEA